MLFGHFSEGKRVFVKGYQSQGKLALLVISPPRQKSKIKNKNKNKTFLYELERRSQKNFNSYDIVIFNLWHSKEFLQKSLKKKKKKICGWVPVSNQAGP